MRKTILFIFLVITSYYVFKKYFEYYKNDDVDAFDEYIGY